MRALSHLIDYDLAPQTEWIPMQIQLDQSAFPQNQWNSFSTPSRDNGMIKRWAAEITQQIILNLNKGEVEVFNVTSAVCKTTACQGERKGEKLLLSSFKSK